MTGFICAGIARLARFNATVALVPKDATGKSKYFEGLPIPSSLILVGLMAICLKTGRIDGTLGSKGLPLGLIESLQQMLEVHLDGALGGVELVELGSVRFTRPALHGDTVTFEVAVSGDRARLVTKATCSSGGHRLARITATWRGRT